MRNPPKPAWETMRPADLSPQQQSLMNEAEVCTMPPLIGENDGGIMVMLRKEIEKLVQAHQLGLNECLEKCLRPEQTRLSLGQAAALPGHVCAEPPDTVEPVVPERSMEQCTSFVSSDERQSVPWMSVVPTHSLADKWPMAVAPVVTEHLELTKDADAPPSPQLPYLDNLSDAPVTSISRLTGAELQSVINITRKRPTNQRRNGERIRTNILDEDTCMQKITGSRYYEWFSGSLILMNAVFIGIQTQVLASQAKHQVQAGQVPRSAESAWVVVVEAFFCLAFSIELGLRWLSDGFIDFFRNSDLWWNIMDVFIVFTSIFDLVFLLAISIAGGGFNRVEELDNISAVRVMRAFRVVRVVRVIRVLTFFRELRMMIYSILTSLKSLIWVIVVLSLTFYLFAVMFTAAVTSHLEQQDVWSDERTWKLVSYFGTLGDSILHLYMAMSGGRDWSEYYEAVSMLHVQYRVFFLLFITFSLFAVVNIVTGVFVESAMQSSTTDREFMLQEELEAKKRYLESMRDLFNEIDENGSNCISLNEFKAKLDDERVLAYLHAMKLDVSDATTLFKLIDNDNSGQVSIHEFLAGCYKLQGESKSLDMKIMHLEVRNLVDNLRSVWKLVSDMHGTLSFHLTK